MSYIRLAIDHAQDGMTLFLIFRLFLLIGQPGDIGGNVEQVAELFCRHHPDLRYETSSKKITGLVKSRGDYEMILELWHRSNSQIHCEVKATAELIRSFLNEIGPSFKKESFQWHFESCQLVVQASVSDFDLEQLRKEFSNLRWVEKKKRSGRQKKLERTIFIELAFVEIKKSVLDRLGIRFGDPISFQTSFHGGASKGFVNFDVNPLASFLDMASQKNFAKVHLKQNLIASEGEEAQFLVGGEYAYRNNSAYTASISKISYGVDLKFKAQMLSSKRIEIELRSNIREPDLTSDIGDFPEIREKNLQTTLQAEIEKTISVGGLFRTNEGNSTQALPGLSRLPILGRLFESKDFRNQQSEAYLFITPRVLGTNGD